MLTIRTLPTCRHGRGVWVDRLRLALHSSVNPIHQIPVNVTRRVHSLQIDTPVGEQQLLLTLDVTEPDDHNVDCGGISRVGTPNKRLMREVDEQATTKQRFPQWLDLLPLGNRVGGNQSSLDLCPLHVVRSQLEPAGHVVKGIAPITEDLCPLPLLFNGQVRVPNKRVTDTTPRNPEAEKLRGELAAKKARIRDLEGQARKLKDDLTAAVTVIAELSARLTAKDQAKVVFIERP